MKTYWLIVMVPVEAANEQDARDLGWERIIDPDGPAEGQIEAVTTAKPVLTCEGAEIELKAA